ncbi:hypothetical protein [Novosphingobium sp. ST904]|nr:hypothetical protein [Novosphingobium sp. ST904]
MLNGMMKSLFPGSLPEKPFIPASNTSCFIPKNAPIPRQLPRDRDHRAMGNTKLYVFQKFNSAPFRAAARRVAWPKWEKFACNEAEIRWKHDKLNRSGVKVGAITSEFIAACIIPTHFGTTWIMEY